ncbi:MAG: transglutaminase family protein [Myxococcales bacterium]|nr:transglutaminase family protein [Myxococcales bacterium]
MRLLIQHRSVYEYPRPAALGPHLVRLRPADHTRAHVESYTLRIGPDEARVSWQEGPQGNRIARVTFRAGAKVTAFDVLVELAVDIHPVNPFDFFLDDCAETVPVDYDAETARSLVPYFDMDDPAYAGPGAPTGRFDAFRAALGDPAGKRTVTFLVMLAQRVAHGVSYVIREEAGVYTPEQCLIAGRGSCRDSAVLLVALLRSYGFAARFVSGYLIQVRDEGMLPDEPRGMDRDVVDLHAWAEVYLPGAGWIGIDGTSGLFCGEGHIPLACTPSPALASPIDGSSDTRAEKVHFETRVGRLGHEVSPTAPYTDDTWRALLDAGEALDARIIDANLTLTTGGEPTFNSRHDLTSKEWLGDALGPSKWAHGTALASALAARMAPGAAIVCRNGKHYPGEPLPRWALEIVGRSDGRPAWPDFTGGSAAVTDADAQRFGERLAARLGTDAPPFAAFEDPWRFLQDEASLPIDVNPLESPLDDASTRSRLARILGRGLATPAGWVLPLARLDGCWRTSAWHFRRGACLLLQGDSPMGLRLPLSSVAAGRAAPEPVEPDVLRRDPRRGLDDEPDALHVAVPGEAGSLRIAPQVCAADVVRTAMCFEARNGELFVFLPPLGGAGDFFLLLEALHETRVETGLDVRLEGYVPASGPEVFRFAVTPDPGVLEVNIPPVSSVKAFSETAHTVFDAALSVGLHAERYLLDGRQQGSGGGNHITLGGPTLLESPFIRRPDLLASILTFLQHHPSLSYLFSGLFVGPTSQAPRVDEARHETLYELEIALDAAFEAGRDGPPVPWLSDMLFRHLLVDLTGNTHRTEVAIDKLCDPGSPHGRQGLIEFRAFEMPPHPRLMVAQVALVRGLVAAFATEPYRGELVRFGTQLHDRFLLPYFLERDLRDALAELARRGVALPESAYLPFLELRCPKVGHAVFGASGAAEVELEVRCALEPWHVLGEEATGTGTARYVDSSVERVEVRARGLVPGRHELVVNGLSVPLRPNATASLDRLAAERDAGVLGIRFRAWAPAHALHPHLGIHHPLRFEVIDTWARRSMGACAYHVWHPEGRAFEAPPLTRFEAGARRAQRFTLGDPTPWPAAVTRVAPHPDTPYTLDLRRHRGDRPMPTPE